MNRYRMSANGHLHLESAPCGDDSCTPVVVISPEDREAVGRLGHLYLAEDRARYGIPIDTPVYEHFVDDMQAALREFANPKPPRPEEPTGLGAVVEDAEGDIWVHDRERLPGYLGVEWLNTRTQAHLRYESIDVVRVLSEGVTS